MALPVPVNSDFVNYGFLLANKDILTVMGSMAILGCYWQLRVYNGNSGLFIAIMGF